MSSLSSPSDPTEAVGLDELKAGVDTFAKLLGRLGPNILVRTEPARPLAVLASTANKTSAAKLGLARRAGGINAWHGRGHRSQAAWLAEKAGTAEGEANRMLDTAEKLEGLPEVADAGSDRSSRPRRLSPTGTGR